MKQNLPGISGPATVHHLWPFNTVQRFVRILTCLLFYIYIFECSCYTSSESSYWDLVVTDGWTNQVTIITLNTTDVENTDVNLMTLRTMAFVLWDQFWDSVSRGGKKPASGDTIPGPWSSKNTLIPRNAPVRGVCGEFAVMFGQTDQDTIFFSTFWLSGHTVWQCLRYIIYQSRTFPYTFT